MRKILLTSLMCSLLMACVSKHDKDLAKIGSLEKTVYTDSSKKVLDKKIARELIESYVDFAKENSVDPKSAESYFKAGEVASAIQMPVEAIEYYAIVYNKYPDYEKAPVALFLQGFINENNLKNLQKAKGFYDEFLKKYPHHSLAKDVQFSIDHLGMSDEELIKMFEEKNKEKQVN